MYKKELIFRSEHIYTDNILTAKSVINIHIKESDEGAILTIIGDTVVKDKSRVIIEHTSGQNSDSLRKWSPCNENANRVADIWDRYANNDLRAGTLKQSEILRQAELDGRSIDYVSALEILEEANLISDNGYKYGSQWLFEDIPQEVIDEIKLKW